VPTASWCQGSRFGTGKQKAANFVVMLYLTIIHQSGGKWWWIFAELRSGEVNTYQSSPTLPNQWIASAKYFLFSKK